MKKIDVSGLERLRKTNLKIGFATALALMLAAFSWTTERPAFNSTFDDLPPDMEVEIKRTYQEPQKELPPPDLPTKAIIENKIIVESDLPDLLSKEIVSEKPVLPDENAVTGEPAPASILELKPQLEEEKVPEIFKIVEDMPLFGDCNSELFSKAEKKKCSDTELLSFLYKHIRYPNIARENGIEGLVVIQFVVEKNGEITDAIIARDIGGGCGQEALRVVNQMPKWIPGKQRGREVRVQYSLPVKFSLD